MTIRTLLPAMAATVAIGVSGAAAAQSVGVSGLGVADANDRGAVAGAALEAQAQNRGQRDRRNRHWRDRDDPRPVPNAASTYGAGSVYTDRNRTSAAVSSGGAASGDGTQSTATTVDAYGETRRDGSSADIYGSSTATSEETRRPRRYD